MLGDWQFNMACGLLADDCSFDSRKCFDSMLFILITLTGSGRTYCIDNLSLATMLYLVNVNSTSYHMGLY